MIAVAAVVGCVVVQAEASQLCKTRRGGLVVRDQCKPREEALDTGAIEALGLRGPVGAVGPAGPPGGGLHVVDANGVEVGAVTQLATYYGQYAQIIREMVLPGGGGPEFVQLAVTTQGLRTSEYACSSYYGTYYRTPDCSGEQLRGCDYGNCSSIAGAFLFTPVAVGTDGVACFTRGGSEFERGDFYRPLSIYAPSIEQATAQCSSGGGTLLGPITECGSPQFPYFCGQCCQPYQDVGVAPVHTVDLSSIGTPPFRLAR